MLVPKQEICHDHDCVGERLDGRGKRNLRLSLPYAGMRLCTVRIDARGVVSVSSVASGAVGR